MTTDQELEDIIPIVGSPDSFYFVLQFTYEDQPCTVTLFAYQDSNIPLYSIYYDYFFTGNIYFNVPKGAKITSVKKEFLEKYKYISFNSEFQKLALEDPESFNNKYSWVSVGKIDIPSAKTSYSEDLSGLFLNFFFFANLEIEEAQEVNHTSPKVISSSEIPKCQYYTCTSSSPLRNDSVSSHYSFANHLEDIPMCSHPSQNGAFATCPWYSQDPSSNFAQSSCAIYSPSVSSVEISKLKIHDIESIDSTIDFELKYFESNENHTFYVKDSSKNTNLIFFTYPISDYSYEDCLPLAKTAFRDFHSLIFVDNTPTYSDPVEEESSLSKPTTYISQLLSI